MSVIFITVAVLAFLFLSVFALIIVQTIARRGRWGINPSPPYCANCGALVDGQFRKPKSLQQALWGGWACEECGCEMDKWGKRVM